MSISDWTPINRNTLIGAFVLTLPCGLIINGCMAHRKNESEWISLPGAPQVDRDGATKRGADGKVLYKTIIRFADKAIYEKFQDPILKELRRLGHI